MSDLLQLVKFWPSCAPGKRSASGREFLAPSYYQPVRSLCVSPSVFFFIIHSCIFLHLKQPCIPYLLLILFTAKLKHRLGRAVFTQKKVFGPHTAKYEPIWIKFCTHLLLYGIHLWADLDRDRRVGGSRPNQKRLCYLYGMVTSCSTQYRSIRRQGALSSDVHLLCYFVILVTHGTHPIIETTDRRSSAANRQWR